VSVKITDNMPRFERSLKEVLDQGLGELSKDILVTARGQTPYDKGALRRESDTHRESLLHWQVRYHMEYALAQEQGYANGRYFKNYTTTGTGSRYLRKAGETVYRKSILILRKHASRAKP